MSIVCEKSHSVDRRLICGLLCGASSHSLSPNFLSSSSCFVLCSVVFFLTRRIYTYWLLLFTHQSILRRAFWLFDWLAGSLGTYIREKVPGIYISGDLQLAGSPRPNQNGRNIRKEAYSGYLHPLYYISKYLVLLLLLLCVPVMMWRTISFTMTSFFSLVLI